MDLCYAEYQTKVCNCSTLVGWNITESRCLDEEEKRKCLLENTSNATLLRIRTEKCLSRCHSKCRQKKFDIKFSKTQNSLVETNISTIIELIEGSENISSSAREVASKLRDEKTSLLEKKQVVQNIAQLFFYFPEKQQWKEIEIIPQISFATFLSNISGLLGMWLGISAMSVLDWMEKLVTFPSSCRKREDIESKK